MASRRLVLAGIFGIAVALVVYLVVPKPLPELSRTEFLNEVRTGHVSRVEIDEDHIFKSKSTTRGAFRVMSPSNEPELLAELRARGVEVVYEKSGLGLI